MQAKLLFSILAFFVMASTSCQTKRYTPLDYNENMIIFGSGGGFAGTVTEYCILENGQVFLKAAFKEEFEPLEDLDKDLVHQLFSNYHSLELDHIKLKKPGNMYYFLKYGTRNQLYEQVWGAYGVEPPEKLKGYYNLLNSLVNKHAVK